MDSEQPIKVSYFWIDLFEDPLNGTIDILKFVCEFMGARERCLRFFFVWQAIKNGDDATSPVVRESIEESVRKALG